MSNLNERVQVWLFYLNFKKNLGKVKEALERLNTAFASLRSNEKFKKILGSILRFGNYMNALDNKKC